jgi:hypothetical protein
MDVIDGLDSRCSTETREAEAVYSQNIVDVGNLYISHIPELNNFLKSRDCRNPETVLRTCPFSYQRKLSLLSPLQPSGVNSSSSTASA